MITYPLALPSVPAPNSQSIEAVNHVAEVVSPFTGTSQTQEWSAEYWKLTMSYPSMPRSSAAEWMAFLAALRGKAGTFLAGPAGADRTPRGVVGGTPVVNGTNSAMSKTLNTKGWTASTANVLRKGDWFQVGSQLFMCLSDASSDSSGDATLDVFPRLRVQYTDATPIITTNPKGTFRLTSNSRKWSINTLQHWGLSVEAREAL